MLRLTEEQMRRYSRQIVLPEIGDVGQKKLLAAKVLVVGIGGLGSPASMYLAGAGVGTIGIAEFGDVEVENLHRQVIYNDSSIGRRKTRVAEEFIKKLNPDVNVIVHDEKVVSANARQIVRGYDVVLDCSDNFPTRYLMNDVCYFEGKPLCHGAIFRYEGQATTFSWGSTPCYRCLFKRPPPPEFVPSCREAGVFAPVAGIIGLVQAAEAIKLILGIGDTLGGYLLLYDALSMDFRKVKLDRNPGCLLCGVSPTIRELGDYEDFCSGG